MPRSVIDPGPFRFTEIHGPHRTPNERFDVGRLLRRRGLTLGRCEFAPEAPLRELYADSYNGARQRRQQDTPRLDEFTALYANGEDVEPLVVMNSDRVLSSGHKALMLLDGRHRTFAAARAGVERLPVYVLLRAEAVFSY